jgi:hypothetical protein
MKEIGNNGVAQSDNHKDEKCKSTMGREQSERQKKGTR